MNIPFSSISNVGVTFTVLVLITLFPIMWFLISAGNEFKNKILNWITAIQTAISAILMICIFQSFHVTVYSSNLGSVKPKVTFYNDSVVVKDTVNNNQNTYFKVSEYNFIKNNDIQIKYRSLHVSWFGIFSTDLATDGTLTSTKE